MNIQLPEQVSFIISRLENAGFEAYAVGGCVRDSILGRIPQDWDITTSALPEETKELFTRTIDTGIEHGTVTVMMGKEGFEITTYRIDGKYSDSRHPDSVSFTRSLEEDLKRRDFTINAMAYSGKELVDMFGGTADLDAHIIKCVGNPYERFKEDALRILRAVRFSAQLDFTVDASTLEAAGELAVSLKNISAERIHTELYKLLMSNGTDRLRTLNQVGIDKIILPELCEVSEAGKLNELIDRLSSSDCEPAIRWALLFKYTGNAREIMRRLKFDNATLHRVCELIRLSTVPLEGIDAKQMRYLMNNAGKENMEQLFRFRTALDPSADYSAAFDLFRQIENEGCCTCIKELAVNGKDLIANGIPAGKTIGDTLDRLLIAVLEEPDRNTKDLLLKLAKEVNS